MRDGVALRRWWHVLVVGVMPWGSFQVLLMTPQLILLGLKVVEKVLKPKEQGQHFARDLKEYYTVHYHLYFKIMMAKYQKHIRCQLDWTIQV